MSLFRDRILIGIHFIAYLTATAIFSTPVNAAKFFGLGAFEQPFFVQLGSFRITQDGRAFATTYRAYHAETDTFHARPVVWRPETGFNQLSDPDSYDWYGISAISDDGYVISGNSSDRAIAWTPDHGQVEFPFLSSFAKVTADGSRAIASTPSSIPFIHNKIYNWDLSQPEQGVELLDELEIRGGFHMNQDGTAITYREADGNQGGIGPGHYWTQELGDRTVEDITGIPALKVQGFETGFVAQNGNLIFRWDDSSQEMTEVITREAVSNFSVSDDGRTIVGRNSSGNDVWVWQESTGTAILDLPSNLSLVNSRVVNSGTIVLTTENREVEAETEDYFDTLLWTTENGVESIQDLLSRSGVGGAISDWTLGRTIEFSNSGPYLTNSAARLSADGRVLVANGINPDGQPDIWIAYLDDVERGDFNRDGTIDVADIDQLTTATKMNPNFKYFDLDDSGVADAVDRTLWVTEIMNTYFGDANLDGEFNSRDLVAIFEAGEYEDQIEGNSTWSTGDWNGDGDFTTTDLVVAFEDGGYEQGPRAAVTVPEPKSLMLAVFGLIGCLRALRSRNNA